MLAVPRTLSNACPPLSAGAVRAESRGGNGGIVRIVEACMPGN